MTVAIRIHWTNELKLLEARLERRTDRALPYPRIRRVARRAIETARVILLPDLRGEQRELWGR